MTFGDDWGWAPPRPEKCTMPSARQGQFHLKTLDEASRIELGFPYSLYATEMLRTFVYAGLRDQILA